MTATALQYDAINETYASVENLIYHTLHRFVKHYGGSVEEWHEYTGSLFMVAYTDHSRSRGKFSTYLQWVLWKGLLEVRRKQQRHKGKVVFTDLDPEVFKAPTDFNLMEFMDSLSEDAQTVVRLVFDTPWQFSEPKEMRQVIRQYLAQPAIGWSSNRIASTFREICSALRG
jgi:DNA-directed RNA polymerase specialized sigma24 family protein